MSPLDKSVISFFATFSEEDYEYSFCSEECLDGFFRDRLEFQAIVKDFEKENDEKGDSQKPWNWFANISFKRNKYFDQ